MIAERTIFQLDDVGLVVGNEAQSASGRVVVGADSLHYLSSESQKVSWQWQSVSLHATQASFDSSLGPALPSMYVQITSPEAPDTLTEVHFVLLQNAGTTAELLTQLFDAFSEAAALNPDPEAMGDEDEYGGEQALNNNVMQMMMQAGADFEQQQAQAHNFQDAD